MPLKVGPQTGEANRPGEAVIFEFTVFISTIIQTAAGGLQETSSLATGYCEVCQGQLPHCFSEGTEVYEAIVRR